MAVRTLTFPADYFSGADVALYFGDLYIDDIAGLAFTLTQQVQPVYGYGSFTFDAVLRGSRLVEGTLRVNFRQAGYLWRLAAQAASKTVQAVAEAARQHRDTLPLRYDFEGYLTDGEIEDILRKAARRDSVQELRAIAAELQRRAWGTALAEEPAREAARRAPPGVATVDPHAPLLPSGFTVTVIYGMPPPPDMVERMRQSGLEEDPASQPAMRFLPLFPAGTALLIEGVHLVSVTQQVDISGNPVFEDYAFLAKDLIPLGWSA